MYRFIARQNVEHFRALLDVEQDEQRRRTLSRLLIEEEAKLDRSSTPASADGEASGRASPEPRQAS